VILRILSHNASKSVKWFDLCTCLRKKITRRSADADKPAWRVYSGHGFLLEFYRNFVPTCTVFEIFAFSNGQDILLSYSLLSLNLIIILCYFFAKVITVGHRNLLSDIEDLWPRCQGHDLGIWVKGHHSIVFDSNYGSILCHFWDIQCRKMSWPWNRGKGHSRSLRVVSLDRLCMVSY